MTLVLPMQLKSPSEGLNTQIYYVQQNSIAAFFAKKIFENYKMILW